MEASEGVEIVFRQIIGGEDSLTMAQQTEAACLLETGALYAQRVLLRPSGGDPIFAGWKHAAFSLYFGDAPIYHFDPEGRWQRAFLSGTHYLKGLDATVQAIDRVREGKSLVLRRRALNYAETSDLDAAVRQAALDLLSGVGSGRLARVDPPPKAQPLSEDDLRSFLEQVASWDAARWFAQRERYMATYGPLPILPPDCQNAVVLQATLGHAAGLAFGGSAPAEHYVRSPAEFAQHARDVAGLLGRRLLQCKSLFMGGGDVLRRPAADVLSYLEAIATVFPVGPSIGTGLGSPRLDGVQTFLDDFAPPRPDRDALREFAEYHLKRVTLGVESGDPGVRALYGKRWSDDDFRSLVEDLKGAGIGVGIMTLVGAGGREYSDSHVTSTTALIDSLPIGQGDLVSLLDANEVVDPRASRPFTPLTGLEWSEEQAELRRRLAPLRSRSGAKVAPYSLEKQSLA